MKTRQKIKPRKKDNQILELGGNKFQVGPYYRLYLDFPFKTECPCFTTDINTGDYFNLIHTKDGNWYGVWYLLHLDMYILRKLIWISYHPEIDIKTAYLYGKKHN